MIAKEKHAHIRKSHVLWCSGLLVGLACLVGVGAYAQANEWNVLYPLEPGAPISAEIQSYNPLENTGAVIQPVDEKIKPLSDEELAKAKADREAVIAAEQEQQRIEAENAQIAANGGYDATYNADTGYYYSEEPAYSSGGGGYNYPSGGGVLTPQSGVNYYNGHRETYYSQNVLPGGGLSIPGRHVADDGTVRDGEGYICVASGEMAKGTVVDTSLGAGKVYDYCGTPGTVDIYTAWG